MPHKLVTNKSGYRVRSYVTGKLLKKKYPKTKAGLAAAKAKIKGSYNRSQRKRSSKAKSRRMY